MIKCLVKNTKCNNKMLRTSIPINGRISGTMKLLSEKSLRKNKISTKRILKQVIKKMNKCLEKNTKHNNKRLRAITPISKRIRRIIKF